VEKDIVTSAFIIGLEYFGVDLRFKYSCNEGNYYVVYKNLKNHIKEQRIDDPYGEYEDLQIFGDWEYGFAWGEDGAEQIPEGKDMAALSPTQSLELQARLKANGQTLVTYWYGASQPFVWIT